MVSRETGIDLERILWELPIYMVFKCIALSYQANSGKETLDHKQRYIAKKQQEKFKELTNGK